MEATLAYGHGESPLDLGLTEAPQPVECAHLGLIYPGELIVSQRWQAQWGQSLQGDLYFRVVLLLSRQNVPADAIKDSRIAVCIPGGGASRRQETLERELRSVRETRAQYSAGRSPGSAVVQRSLDKRAEELEALMTAQAGERYASGSIQSPVPFDEKALKEVFGEEGPVPWVQGIAAVLLAGVYPTVPLYSSLLPRPVRSEDIPLIYKALFSQTPEELRVLGELGPGLGLSKPAEPLRFDPSECVAFQYLREELAEGQGELLWPELRRSLGHGEGLTYPVATLYMLAFAHHAEPEVELVLTSGHGLILSDGHPLPGRRVSRELLAFLEWRDDLGDKVVALRLPQPVSWDDALPYTSRLCQELTEVGDGGGSTTQEAVLQAALSQLGERERRCRTIVEDLSQALAIPNRDELMAALDGLRALCESQDYQTVYLRARGRFESPMALSQAVTLLDRLEDLEVSGDEIKWVRDYLDGASIEAGPEDLSLIRQALLQQLALPTLLESPQGWRTVSRQFEQFQRQYIRAYGVSHRQYHEQAALLLADLEDAGLEIAALVRLNAIAQLGAPVGEGLREQHQRLRAAVKACDLGPPDLSIDIEPRCFRCNLALGEREPAQEVALFLRSLKRSLREQNQRLSLVLAERILGGDDDPRLDTLIKIVQISDLSALVNVLDDQMVQFLGDLLADMLMSP